MDSNKGLCVTSTFGGDLSCDFESSNWSEGDCNWQYSFLSHDVFDTFFEMETNNHALQFQGSGFIALQSTADLSCNALPSNAIFGFFYKLSSGTVRFFIVTFCPKN